MKSTPRPLLKYYLLAIFLLTTYIALGAAFTKNEWTIGDWLINYHGGFVRRGLFGEAALWLQAALGPDPVAQVFVIQLACYAILFSCSYRLLQNLPDLRNYALLILSPALFPFQIYDSLGGFRKEILFFALLAINCLAAAQFSNRQRHITAWLSLAVYPLLILSHEQLAVLLPLLLVAQRDVFMDSSRAKLQCAALLAVNLVAFGFCVSSQADWNTVRAICQALADFCQPDIGQNGAITWLATDARFGFEQVQRIYFNPPSLGRQLLLLILCGLAFVPIRNRLKPLLDNSFDRALLLISGLGLILVMLVAIDWGRMMYIAAFSLFLLSLARRESVAALSWHVPTGLLIIYALAWRLPHTGTNSMLSPYLALITDFLG